VGANRFPKESLTSHRRRHHGPLPAVAVSLLALSAWSLSPAGIIELGVKGQKAGGSTFRVVIEGRVFTEGSHDPNEPVESIRDKIIANINASGTYTASAHNPSTLSAMLIMRGSSEPNRLEVFVDDPNIVGAYIQYDMNGGFHAHLYGVNTVQQNGTFEVDFTVHPGGVISHVINTAGKTAAQVNAELVADFTADGFVFDGPPSGPWDISKFGICFGKIEMKATDTGVHISGVELDASSSPSIPTLSEWGLIALTILLSAIAVTLIRRRARRTI